jgi:effector-binding domain-containing protein
MDKIKIQIFKPVKLAYIEHIGKYDEVPYDKYVPRLYAWAKENKVRPGFKNINVFHDDPQQKNPSECKCWIGIPIKGNVKSDHEVKIEELPEKEVVTMKFKGPGSEYKDAYEKINKWMNVHNYEWDGPSFEICSKKPKMVNGDLILSTTIQVPIKKK